MRERSKIGEWLIPLFIALVVPSFGASLQATLEGKVEEIKDPPAGIEGVEVAVLDGKGKPLKVALTDRGGSYTIPGLPRDASVSIKLTKKGYKENPTILDQVKLSAERTVAPKVGMVQSQGDSKYYAGVAKEIQRRLQVNPSEGKKFHNLLESLGPAERAMVNQELRGKMLPVATGVFDPSVAVAVRTKALSQDVQAGPPIPPPL